MNLTHDDLMAGYDNPEWGGHGYLRARQTALSDADPECPPQPEQVAAADAYVLAHANTSGWTAADLFEWADSKHGRWFGDVWFGGSDADRVRFIPDLMTLPR